MVYLTRKAEFSASHYYHNPEFTPEENQRIFGKCNNPHGHGHNYTVEVIVGGEVNPATGMVLDLAQLDGCVGREVLELFDHENLNTLECFREVVPTTENLVIEIRRRLKSALPQKMTLGVRVEETSNNFFEYYEEPIP